MSIQSSASPRLAPGAPPPAESQSAIGRFVKDLNIEFDRIFQNAIVSGFGGLVGWLVMTLLYMLFVGRIDNVYVRHILTGPFLGMCIGFAVGSTEGLFASKSMQRLLRGGLFGAALGAAGGLVGLALGELFFDIARAIGLGSVLPRALAWGLFGMFVGISDGVANKMPAKIRYGLLGGLLGGLIGGSTYQALLDVLPRGLARDIGGAIGLIILAACIGFLISLVESLLRKSWLFFITGRLEGQTRTLDSSRPHTLGTAPSCTIVLPDKTVAPVHAEVVFADGEFRISPRDGKVLVRHDGVESTVAGSQLLGPGDRITVGETKMLFRNVEGKKKS